MIKQMLDESIPSQAGSGSSNLGLDHDKDVQVEDLSSTSVLRRSESPRTQLERPSLWASNSSDSLSEHDSIIASEIEVWTGSIDGDASMDEDESELAVGATDDDVVADADEREDREETRISSSVLE